MRFYVWILPTFVHNFIKVIQEHPKFDFKMNKSVIKNIFFAVVAMVAVSTLFSACQRGSGCPYKFEAKSDLKK